MNRLQKRIQHDTTNMCNKNSEHVQDIKKRNKLHHKNHGKLESGSN